VAKASAKTAAKKKTTAKKTTAKDEADPRFVPVAAALARTAGFSLMESKSRALRGLMLYGKSFGMSSHGRFFLKLTEERVAELVTQGVGVPMRSGADRAMKGWLDVTDPKADWVALAKEACRLAAAAAKRPATAATKSKRTAKTRMA
jgi:hypothetical protein